MNSMTIGLREFGSHLADGAEAAKIRLTRIDPYMGICDEVILDFSGIRSANSSFVNALVAGLIEQHGEIGRRKLAFKGCTPTLRVLIDGAVTLGIQKMIA